MPLRVQNDLPARSIIEKENIYVMDENKALTQDIRPLKMLLLNLMPLKEDTEIQFLRCLSNTPLQIDLTFMYTATYASRHTSASHLNNFYVTFDEIKDQKFDGMIITGAPIEQMEYEEVAYWEELCKIMEWTKTHVTSTFHICWGAQAALYYHYGIKKKMYKEKLFGVYKHRVLHRKVPIARGFDDVFYVPHSRYTGVDEEKLASCKNLRVIANSKEAGSYIIMTRDGKQFFITGHSEYDRMSLDSEYKRDLLKGLDTKLPYNYYPEDDPNQKPDLTWRAASNCLYSNWINYYVYAATPFDITKVGEEVDHIHKYQEKNEFENEEENH